MWYYVEESRREKMNGILDINDLYEFSLNILEPVLTGMFTKDECEHEVDSNLTCKLCNKKQIAVFGENEDFVRHIFIEKWE